MKAVVHVTYKKTVLDPQGRTISSKLNGLGYQNVRDVRQGKYFEIEIADGSSREEVEAQIGKIAHEVLANPVIEEYSFELAD